MCLGLGGRGGLIYLFVCLFVCLFIYLFILFIVGGGGSYYRNFTVFACVRLELSSSTISQCLSCLFWNDYVSE